MYRKQQVEADLIDFTDQVQRLLHNIEDPNHPEHQQWRNASPERRRRLYNRDQCLEQNWRTSRQGNPYLEFGDYHVVIFDVEDRYWRYIITQQSTNCRYAMSQQTQARTMVEAKWRAYEWLLNICSFAEKK